VNNFARAFQNIVLICLALLAFILPERIFAADSYAEAARELTGKIMANIGPADEVGFTFQSLASSLGPKEVVTARQAIENELSARGLKFTKDSQATRKLGVTLSETLYQYIWIAEIQHNPGYQVVMTTQARTSEPPAIEAARMTIQSKPIYEQNDPILDIKLLGDDMLLLDSKQFALYRRQNDRWIVVNSAPFKSSYSFPRDVRGRLGNSGNAIQAHLPGLLCNGTVKPAFEFNCSQDETPWQLGPGSIAPTFSKNYFIQENMPDFFSAASIEDGGTELLVLAGTDGRTYLYDKTARQVGTFDGWGSEIASVSSECGARRQIFASLSTDSLEYGAIQAFEIVYRKAVAISSAVEFPGPITALWPISNQNAAIAVSHDIKTGRYAAFYLSIACSR
jgi:hypothetical protein